MCVYLIICMYVYFVKDEIEKMYLFCDIFVFMVGMGKGVKTENPKDNQDAYLQLSVTILAAFCRVPNIASSDDMVKKIPLILEILSKE